MTESSRRIGVDRWDLGAWATIAAGMALLHIPMRAGTFSDQGIYVLMAQDPLGALRPAPFVFRVGTPLLAAALPFGLALSFQVIGVAAMSATASIIRRTADHLAGRRRGLVAMVLFVGSGVVLLTLRTPYASEPLSMLAGAAGLELGRRRRWLAAGLVVAVGATARETTLFVLLPLAVWCLAAVGRRRDRVVSLAALCGPGIATYLVLHRTPVLYGTVPPEHVQRPAEILAWNLHAQGGFGRYLVVVALGSLGLLWLYLPAATRSADRYLSSTVLLFVPLLLGTTIASDWGRILGYGIIVAATATAVLAPWRVLRLLVPAQLAIGALVHVDEAWAAAAIALGGLVAIAATNGLHDERPTTSDELAARRGSERSSLGSAP